MTTTQNDITQRTDSGVFQGQFGTKAQGWPEDTSSWQHLISSTHDNAGNYYALQIAGPFFDNENFYVRKTAGNGNQQWRRLNTDDDNRLRQVHLRDYGSTMGNSDQTGPMDAARQAVAEDGVIEVGPGRFFWQGNFRTNSPSKKSVLWSLPGSKNDAAGVNIISDMGTDTVETFYGGGRFLSRQGSWKGAGPVLRVDGKITHTDGKFGNVASVFSVNAEANVGAGDFVWAQNHQFTCRIPAGGGGGVSAANQSVGFGTRSVRPEDALGDGAGVRGPLWGMLLQTEDRTGQPSNISGALIGAEWNIAASDGDPGNSRIGFHMTFNRPGNTDGTGLIGNPARIGYGIMMSGENTTVGQGSYVGTGIAMHLGWDNAAFDTSEGVALNGGNAPAFKRAAGQYHSWEATNFFRDKYQDGAFRWYAGIEVMSLDGAGVLTANSFVGKAWRTSPAGLPSGAMWVDQAAGNVVRVV